MMLPKPEIEDATLGTLRWDDRMGLYATKILFGPDATINLQVADIDDTDPHESAARAARTFTALQEREDTLRKEITAALLGNYNENWNGGDDEDDDDSDTVPMDAETFAGHLKVRGMTFYADGNAELYYGDGGLFLGHTILVSTDEGGQFQRATLAG